MTRKPRTKAQRPRAMNPRVTLRASTIQSKKKVASKRACRDRIKDTD